MTVDTISGVRLDGGSRWAVLADNPNAPTGDEVTITLRGYTSVLTAEDARSLAEAIALAADHQGHVGDRRCVTPCPYCEAERGTAGRCPTCGLATNDTTAPCRVREAQMTPGDRS